MANLESRWYLCKNCQCHFKSPLYRQLCFVCGGDEYEWTLFEKLFAAAVMVGLLLAMVLVGCDGKITKVETWYEADCSNSYKLAVPGTQRSFSSWNIYENTPSQGTLVSTCH